MNRKRKVEEKKNIYVYEFEWENYRDEWKAVK